MLTGAQSREQLEAVHQATSLPLCVLSPPADARNDSSVSGNSNGVRILMLGNPTFGGCCQSHPRQPEAPERRRRPRRS